MENKESHKINITINQSDLEKYRLESEDVGFISDSKVAMLSNSTPYIKYTLFTIAGFFLVALVWLKVAKVDEITRGMGKIVPLSQVQIIQNLEGGIVQKVYVKEGAVVKKGQELMMLDDTQFESQYLQWHTKYLTLLAAMARLEAEISNQSGIKFSPEVEKEVELVAQERVLFNKKMQLFRNTINNLESSFNLAQKELNIVKPLVKQGVMSKIDLLRSERDVADLSTRINSFRDNFIETETSDLNKNRDEANVLKENLAALKDRMLRTKIISPVNGIVKQIYINTVGGVVKPAEPIMEVVPLNDNLIVEAQIRPSDIGFVKVGHKAKIKITAYDYSIYGGLDAVVTNIGADTNIDARGNAFYEVTLKANKDYIGKKPGAMSIMPGMMASVDIITGKKSVLTYILKPILKARENALRER